MSSSGVTTVNSGPLIIRTYLDDSPNNTYVLGKYNYPVSTNRILITSTSGLVTPSDNIYISSITVSTINAGNIFVSSLIASTITSESISVSSLVASTLIANNFSVSSLITSSIVSDNLSVSSLLASTISTTSILDSNGSLGNPGDTLHTDGSIVYWAPDSSGTSFWTLNGNDINNNNPGDVIINNNLNCSSLINASTIFAPINLHISSNQSTLVTANRFEFFSQAPYDIGTFKVELNGTNFQAYKSTVLSSDATFLQNNGGGQLVLATNNPVVFINGGTNNVGITEPNPQYNLDIKNTLRVNAGSNDILGPGGYMSQFIRTASSGTTTVDYQVTSDGSQFTGPWQDARYVYNNNNTPNLTQVWGIVTSSNITPVGPNFGDIHFYNNVYIDKEVGIGTTNPQAFLHVAETSASNYQEFTTPGTYTVTIPSNAIELEFEMVGAGGQGYAGLAGSGGYIKGTINVALFQGQTITIVVGSVGYQTPPPISNSTQSGATYIYIPSNTLFVMCGAGGGDSTSGGPASGGYGGGGLSGPNAFTYIGGSDWVAIGGSGNSVGSSVGGGGGQLTSGGSAGNCLGLFPGVPGNDRNSPTVPYEEALGGSNNTTAAGGNGYTGGGSGCAGGGGSSYYNSAYTTIISSYSGINIPVSVLPSYGRNNKGGYVSITFPGSEPSIVTNGAVGIGTTNPYVTLQTVINTQTGLNGIATRSADVNTIIGAYSEAAFLGQNAGSIQATNNGTSFNPYTLALNPRGGTIFIGSTISNCYILSGNVGIGSTSPQTRLDINGGALSKQIVTSTITSAGPTTLDPGFFGKYIFVDPTIAAPTTINLPGGATEGTVLIVRNLMTANTVTIGGSVYTGGTNITANTAASYVFTTYAGGGGQWVAL